VRNPGYFSLLPDYFPQLPYSSLPAKFSWTLRRKFARVGRSVPSYAATVRLCISSLNKPAFYPDIGLMERFEGTEAAALRNVHAYADYVPCREVREFYSSLSIWVEK